MNVFYEDWQNLLTPEQITAISYLERDVESPKRSHSASTDSDPDIPAKRRRTSGAHSHDLHDDAPILVRLKL